MTHPREASSFDKEKRLVVNADDYGYYACVSRGILEAAAAGSVTAAGVLANSPRFDDEVERLSAIPSLDIGVHLTLTFGAPVTTHLKTALSRWGGNFPTGKLPAARALLTGELPLERVAEEWAAQLRKCLAAGLRVQFLNTHEHVHLMPQLRGVIVRLAAEHGIPFVRALRPEWRGTNGLEAVVRNAAFLLASWPGASRSQEANPTLLGVGASGRLDLPYLAKSLRSLEPGRAYELMCHPGRLDPREIRDPRLLSYHRWDEEREVLMSDGFRSLCRENGIRLVGFRDLRRAQRPGRGESTEEQR